MKDRTEGRYHSSITTFSRILNADPTLHRARLELAVTYYKVLQYEEAIAEAKKVASNPTVPPNVRIAVLAFIAQSKKEAQQVTGKTEWRFPVSVGYLADDNVNIGPSSSLLPSGFILDPISLPKSDNAIEIGLGINHIYQTAKMLHFGSSPTMLYLLSGANIYNRNYFSEDTDNSIFSLHTGPALIGQKKWRALLSLQWDRLQYANDPLADFYTATSSFTWHLPHAIEATGEIVLGKRQYIGAEYTNRDNTYFAPRILIGYVTPRKKFSFQASLQQFKESADDIRYANNGTNFFFGANWNCQRSTNLYVNYNRKDVQYDGFEPTFTIQRDEVQHRYTIGLSQELTSMNPLFHEWSIGVKASITKNNSNVMTTDYDRNQYSLTLSKTF